MQNQISVVISLQNPTLGNSFQSETIKVSTDYKNDASFQAKVSEYKNKAKEHNHKMGTEEIDDSVMVFIEAVDSKDAKFAETLDDYIY